MKKLTKTILLTLFLILSIQSFSQAESKKINFASASIVESSMQDLCEIVLLREGKEADVIPLVALKKGVERFREGKISNQKTILKMLSDMNTEGYEVISITSDEDVLSQKKYILFKKTN